MNARLPACPLFVLLVEDNADCARNMAMLLRFYGHEVYVAENEWEAVQSIEVITPDAILMDIGLPGDDGYQVAERVLARLEHKPLLVAMTGYGQLAERSKKAGFHYHFEKPVDPDQIADLLAAYAEKVVSPG